MTSLGRRPHVLYVAWGFPPMAGGGTYRTLATANTLVEVGFDVTVLTAEREAFAGFTGVDPALEERIDPAINVVRIPFDRPAADFDIRNWPPERIKSPEAWLEAHRARVMAEFPERTFGAWLQPMLASCEAIHAARRVDLVIGSANPHVVLAAGNHMYGKYGVPHVIDHRDAWRLDCYAGVEVHLDEPRVAALETQFMESAHRVWFVNQSIREWHQALYPQAAHKMRVVENGYDAEFVPAADRPLPDRERPLQFTYVGTLSRHVPVEEFVCGWIAGHHESPELASARAGLYGPMVPLRGRSELVAEAAQYGVRHLGPVPKSEVAGIYSTTDVLLLLLGAGSFVTSGKVYEYVASGLPIVSVHPPGNEASEVLRGYPLWFPVEDLTPPAIGRALAAAAKVAREISPDLRAKALAFAEPFERGRQLRGPIAELFEFVQSGRAT